MSPLLPLGIAAAAGAAYVALRLVKANQVPVYVPPVNVPRPVNGHPYSVVLSPTNIIRSQAGLQMGVNWLKGPGTGSHMVVKTHLVGINEECQPGFIQSTGNYCMKAYGDGTVGPCPPGSELMMHPDKRNVWGNSFVGFHDDPVPICFRRGA